MCSKDSVTRWKDSNGGGQFLRLNLSLVKVVIGVLIGIVTLAGMSLAAARFHLRPMVSEVVSTEVGALMDNHVDVHEKVHDGIDHELSQRNTEIQRQLRDIGTRVEWLYQNEIGKE